MKLVTQFLGTQEGQDVAIKLINSAPLIAIVTALVPSIQWNLEHVAWDSHEKRFVRLSTQDTSNLRDPDKTPLAPPILSTTVRLTDAGADTAEQAAKLAQSAIKAQQDGGLLGLLSNVTGIR